jgi:hypothetical protein
VAPVLRLQAEKKVFSRQAVADITPADAAARLVCMSEEGQVGMHKCWFASLFVPAADSSQCSSELVRSSEEEGQARCNGVGVHVGLPVTRPQQPKNHLR